jgi:hypothetical protein
MAHLIHPIVMQWEIQTKKLFGMRSKVPIIKHLLQPNSHSFLSIRCVCRVASLTHATAMRGELRMIKCSASRVKSPSLLTEFNLTSFASCACAVSSMSHHTAMCGEIETKNYFSIMSKVPFITELVQPI